MKSNATKSTAGSGFVPPWRHFSAATATPWPGICALLSGATAVSLQRASAIRSSVVRRHGRTLDPAMGTPLSEQEIDVLDDLEDLAFSWEVA
jgi:hypothetical protein